MNNDKLSLLALMHIPRDFSVDLQGRIQDFKLGGGVLRKIGPSGGRRENFGVFRMKNHDFTQKNHIFSNFRGGGRAGCAPPLDPPLDLDSYLPVTCFRGLEYGLFSPLDPS
jgi:hypothetical protein